MVARRRPGILQPGYWHPQAAGRRGNFLLNGPVTRRPASIGIGAYTRLVQGIPLTGGQGATVVSSPGAGGATIVQGPVVIPNALSGSFPKATTAGNCVVVIVCAFNTTSGDVPSVSGVTLGGAAGNFASGASAVSGFIGAAYSLAEIWVDYNCAGGQTAIAVSGTNLTVNASFGIILYEVSGVFTSNPVDQSSTDASSVTGTAWTSGTTPGTSQANEIWFAANCSTQAAVQPGSPWVTSEFSSNGLGGGYRIVTAAGTAAFAGTQSPTGGWAAAVVTLKADTPSSAMGGLATISVGPQGLGNVWYPAQVNVQTTSLQNDTSLCQVFMGPAQQPVTLLGTIFPGGFGTLAAAVPAMTPGQYLIAQWTGGNPGDVASLNVIGTMDSIMPG